MHENSMLMFEKYALPLFRGVRGVLEIGPDNIESSSYRRKVNDPSLRWDTLDIYAHPSLTFTAVSEYEFPIPSDEYDIVLCGQVLEHVRKVWRWLPELNRVCKPSGHVVVIAPASWPYHEAPIDCWRVYAEGMTALMEDSGLEVLTSRSETLEGRPGRRFIPGRSLSYMGWKGKTFYGLLNLLGLPVERSVDTIGIGRKLGA